MAGNSKKPRKRGPNSSRQRDSKVKTGKRGAKRTILSEEMKVNQFHGGIFKTMKPAPGSKWQGVSSVVVPFDAEQAKKNIAAGFCRD